MKEYDDQSNLRLSAVRNGPAAGLDEMGPRETTFTNAVPAAFEHGTAEKLGSTLSTCGAQSYCNNG
jgi:hypothetical protein